jgi:hypothetical protein
MTSAQTPAHTASADEQPADRLEILEVSSNLGLLVDAREWAALAALFTDPVRVDYTSLLGGEPQTLAPSELVAGWRQNLQALDSTQHLIANQAIQLDGDEASCAANVQATHLRSSRPEGPFWTVGGRYDYGLTRIDGRWRISALTLTVRWEVGDRQILQPAQGDE